MDTSLAQAIVQAHVLQMTIDLNVQDWNLAIAYGHLDEDMGQVHMFTDYRKATITLDPSKHDDPAELLRTLRHELLHLHLGPYDLAEEALMQLLEERDQRLLRRLYTAACEQTVRNLETMLDHGIGYTAPRPAPKHPQSEAKKRRK